MSEERRGERVRDPSPPPQGQLTDRAIPSGATEPAAPRGLIAVADRGSTQALAIGLQRHAGNAGVARLIATAPRREPVAQREPAVRPLSEGSIAVLLWELDDVLFQENNRLITDTSDPHQAAFADLFTAIVGHEMSSRKLTVGGQDRRERFDRAVLALKPVIVRGTDAHRAALSRWRTKLFDEEASDRTARTVVVGDKVIETGDEAHPEEEKEALHEVLPTLVENLHLTIEQLHRLGEGDKEAYEHAIHAIEHEPHYEHLEGLLESMEHGLKKSSNVVDTLGSALALLGMVDGWLTLNDEEFKEHAKEIHGTLKGVSTMVELVKVAVELGIGSAGMTAVVVWAVAAAAGDSAMAASALGVAGALGGTLANAVAAIEIVHGFLVLLDSHASATEKEGAVVGVASGLAWFGGRALGGAAVGGPASTAILLTYGMLKLAAALYWQGALGINTLLLKDTFEYMQLYGGSFARMGEHAAAAAGLLKKERDPHKAQALADEQRSLEASLAVGLDDFLDHARPKGAKDMGTGGSNATAPGNVAILAEAFAPLQRYRGVKSGPALAEGVAHVLSRITWCLLHANDIAVASTHKGKTLDDVLNPKEARLLAPGGTTADAMREVGAVETADVRFKIAGYRPEDAIVDTTRIPGVDILWFLSGTNTGVTLGHVLGRAKVTFESSMGSQLIQFTKDKDNRLDYPKDLSDTEQYFRGVARQMGQGQSTMEAESRTGMTDVYSHLMNTPLAEANLRRP